MRPCWWTLSALPGELLKKIEPKKKIIVVIIFKELSRYKPKDASTQSFVIEQMLIPKKISFSKQKPSSVNWLMPYKHKGI